VNDSIWVSHPTVGRPAGLVNRAFRRSPTRYPTGRCGCTRSSSMVIASSAAGSATGSGLHPQRPRLDRPGASDRSHNAGPQGRVSDDRRRGRGMRPASRTSIAFVRRWPAEAPRSPFLYAFDLLEPDGQDLRRSSWEERHKALGRVLRGSGDGIQSCEHLARGDRIVRFTWPTDAILRAATYWKLNLPSWAPGNRTLMMPALRAEPWLPSSPAYRSPR